MTMQNAKRDVVRPGKAARGGRGRGAAPNAGARLLRRAVLAVAVLAGLAGTVALAGFLAFTAQIAAREPDAVKPADGIVVLTGGPSRIIDAVSLLTEGRGQRLLISGVNPAISADEMRRALPDGERLMGCCIDLGHKALNTRGNAIEVAEWARDRRFRSLVVVTSSWHMPRAMMELGRMMPGVELVAFPVVAGRTQPERWWSDVGTLKLLVKEYVKFIMATVKIRPAQAMAPVVASASENGHGASEGMPELGIPPRPVQAGPAEARAAR